MRLSVNTAEEISQASKYGLACEKTDIKCVCVTHRN
jgi:hypothetical protein